MIELKDLDIGYRSGKQNTYVFKGLNASFGKGELIGLVGNNGVGKSTLLKTITGNLELLGGDILLEGKSVKSLSVKEIAKRISLVLTDKIGGFNLTVFDVVASGRIPFLNAFGQLKDTDLEIIRNSIFKVGVDHLAERRIDELSDGQRQKVMIAKSLAQQTPLILLDEPTAFLDYSSRQQLFLILRELASNEQKTIIISSHDLDILFKNVDKVFYLMEENNFECNAPHVIQKLIHQLH
jgi:iron complex transport system ATP-binding protein